MGTGTVPPWGGTVPVPVGWWAGGLTTTTTVVVVVVGSGGPDEYSSSLTTATVLIWSPISSIIESHPVQWSSVEQRVKYAS